MWEKVKRACLRSVTIAVSYVLAGIGMALQFIDSVSLVLGDSTFKDELRQDLASYPEILGWLMIAISVIVFLARLRSIMGWGGPK